MLLIGYWLAVYSAISLPEHFIFKRGIRGYSPEHYDQPKYLPPSFAALGAFCFGVVGAGEFPPVFVSLSLFFQTSVKE